MRPWSYSRLSTWEECPRQYQYYYKERLDGFRPPSIAAGRGTELHSQGEAYLKGDLKIYPPEFQKVSAHAMYLKKMAAEAEIKLAVNEKWEPVDYESPEVYLRCIIDIKFHERGDDKHVVHIQDWKTGQIYDSHKDQLDTYVAIAASHFPDATEYRSRAVYIDLGTLSTPKVVPPDRVKPIRLMLDGRIKNAESDTIYPTRSGTHCRWCTYSRKFGGPCAF